MTERLELSGAKVTIEGIEPFYVTVHNDALLKGDGALDEYMAARRVALGGLLVRGGNVRAVVWGDTAMELSTALGAFADRRISTEQVVVDVYQDGRWLTRAGLGSEVHPIETQGASDIAAQLEAIVRDGAADALPLLDDAPLEFRLHMARIIGSVGAVKAISDREDVLFVDPVTDLLETANGRASRVEVGRVPNILMAWVGEEVAAGRRVDPFQPQSGGNE